MEQEDLAAVLGHFHRALARFREFAEASVPCPPARPRWLIARCAAGPRSAVTAAVGDVERSTQGEWQVALAIAGAHVGAAPGVRDDLDGVPALHRSSVAILRTLALAALDRADGQEAFACGLKRIDNLPGSRTTRSA
jgi:hypothetical protein